MSDIYIYMSSYLEDYWPCASGLSAVNAIGMHLCDPINSGLCRWPVDCRDRRRRGKREEGNEPVSKHQNQPGCGE